MTELFALSPGEVPSFRYAVGIDIGSQSCSVCVCKPDKTVVLKSSEFANAASGFETLLTKLQGLGVRSEQLLIGMEATSRYGENLYQFLASRGYQLCLLHPAQTHQFSRRRGLRAKTDRLDAVTIAHVSTLWRGASRVCS